jgi:hypothetical protein
MLSFLLKSDSSRFSYSFLCNIHLKTTQHRKTRHISTLKASPAYMDSSPQASNFGIYCHLRTQLSIKSIFFPSFHVVRNVSRQNLNYRTQRTIHFTFIYGIKINASYAQISRKAARHVFWKIQQSCYDVIQARNVQ